MNKFTNHLLFCITEEAGEISQEIGKIGRFGIYSVAPKNNEYNLYNLKNEIGDLLAVWEMLCSELNEDAELNRTIMLEKKEKVLRYWREVESE